ncbi:MAG: hypothetical protein R2862_13150 [Thermoanaerobaculia bacterium]
MAALEAGRRLGAATRRRDRSTSPRRWRSAPGPGLERIDSDFFTRHYGHAEFDLVRQREGNDPADDLFLAELAWIADRPAPPVEAVAANRYDLDSLLSWLVSVVVCGTGDLYQDAMVRDRTGLVRDGWFWIHWDHDMSSHTAAQLALRLLRGCLSLRRLERPRVGCRTGALARPPPHRRSVVPRPRRRPLRAGVPERAHAGVLRSARRPPGGRSAADGVRRPALRRAAADASPAARRPSARRSPKSSAPPGTRDHPPARTRAAARALLLAPRSMSPVLRPLRASGDRARSALARLRIAPAPCSSSGPDRPSPAHREPGSRSVRHGWSTA